jgi:hypothetical protein
MGLEGAAPPEQAAVEQESKLPAADAADAAAGAELSDTLMLDAQIAEGMNNIDVIRYLKHCYVGPLGPRLCYNPTAVHAPVPMLTPPPSPAGFCRESERNKPYIGDLESLDSLRAGRFAYVPGHSIQQ